MMKRIEKIIDSHLEDCIQSEKWEKDLIAFQHTNSRLLIEWKLKIELIKALQNVASNLEMLRDSEVNPE